MSGLVLAVDAVRHDVDSILSASGRRVLSEFKIRNVLVGFDYDGTLAPIASRPGGARMRAATRALLRRVASRFACIVISGRAYADIAWRVRGVPLRRVFGNHGIEPLWADAASAAIVSGWVRRLRPRLTGNAGIIIEDKTYSLAVHYRAARDRRRARRLIDVAIADLKDARAIEGRAAVNIVPKRGPDKGVALRQACRAADCRAAVYVGDDGTDEDAFGALPPNRLLSIRVGRSEDSLARFTLPRQSGIDSLLRALLE